MTPVPLALRSYFSLCRGLYSPEQWASWAATAGYPAVGMADRNNLYGLVRWIQACEREGIKALAGAILVQGDVSIWAWCLDRSGLGRLNTLITALLEEERTLSGIYNLTQDLISGGWKGLRIASGDPVVLEALARRTTADLRVALEVGRPGFADLAAWARKKSILPLAVGHWVSQEPVADGAFYRLMRAIGESTTLEELSSREVLKDYWEAKPLGSLEAYFGSCPQALDEASRLAEEADTGSLLNKSFVFPPFQGLTEPQAYRRLEDLCLAGVLRRFGAMTSAVRERLNYELEIIGEKGFATYFLVVHDIVSRFPRTCGRGSGAASIVSYLLGITHVEPLRYNLFFERFLNRGRVDPPDIDVDFPWDERHQALDYVFKAYPGRSGLVADHVTFSRRSIIREPAKANGLDDREIDRLLNLWELGKWEEIPDFIQAAARRIKGFPHYLGSHPGGVVITPDALSNHTHVQTSPLGWPVIAWEKDAAEDAGLVKIDLLGNRSLAVLRDCMTILNPHLDKPLDWESFQPYDDGPTIAQIEGGDTLGVFYVESPATRLLLRKMGRGDFEHLVAASSIIRPAANRYISAYVERLRGKKWDPVDPDMEAVLADTYGIMVYQEDVSRVAMAVAGFDAAEADGLRKILSKKDRHLKLESLRERFFEKARARGRTDLVLEKIWSMILSFEGYSFCKPHSASYALVSMRLAYLKHHHPLAFYTCVINNGGGFYRRQTYLNAVRRLGVPLLSPDVNASRWEYTIEGPITGLSKNQSLRVGLCQLGDIDATFLVHLVSTRDLTGPFRDLEDFLIRTSARLAQMAVLIRSGTLDSLKGPYNRPQIFWIFHHAQKQALFPGLPAAPKIIGDYSPALKLQDEMKTLGMVISTFPLDLVFSRARQMVQLRHLPPLVNSRQMDHLSGTLVSTAGLFVTCKPVSTSDRQAMAFVSLEDSRGMIECVAFPEAWTEVSLILRRGWAFLAVGMVTEDQGTCLLELRSLYCLNKPS